MAAGIGSTFTGEICIRTQPSQGIAWNDPQYLQTQDGDLRPGSLFNNIFVKAPVGSPDYTTLQNNGTYRSSGTQYSGPNTYANNMGTFCGTLDWTIVCFITWIGSNNGVGQPGTASPTVGQNLNSYDHWSIFVQMDIDNSGGTIPLPTAVQEFGQGFLIQMISQPGVQFRPAATWQT